MNPLSLFNEMSNGFKKLQLIQTLSRNLQTEPLIQKNIKFDLCNPSHMDNSLILKIDAKLYAEKKDVILEMFMTDPVEMKKMLQLMVAKIPSITMTILKIIIDLKLHKDVDMTNTILDFLKEAVEEKEFYDAISIFRVLSYLDYIGFIKIKKSEANDSIERFLKCETLTGSIEDLKIVVGRMNFDPKEIEIACPELYQFFPSLPDNVDGDMIAYRQLIKNFEFDRNSCVLNILKYSIDSRALARSILWYAADNESDVMYLISIMTSLSREGDFLEVFMKEATNSKLKGLFLAILFEQNDLPEESLAEFICEQDLKIMITICNLNSLKKFLSKYRKDLQIAIADNKIGQQDISIENPEKMSKEVFFKEFCRIAKYSITHFLTYLEQFQDHFALNNSEQETFLQCIFESNSNPVYLAVVLEKLKRFGVIDEAVFGKYRELID